VLRQAQHKRSWRWGLIAPVLLAAYDPGPIVVTRVDPLTVQDDDFDRHRDPATWRGLTVDRIDFSEERATWRLYRIADRSRPSGPLWFVPHDDENAGFEAAMVGLRKYGGTLIAVDSSAGGQPDGIRRNRSVGYGRGLDPNRVFHDGLPRYASTVLAPLAEGAWPIIALHSNSPGYDPKRSTCARPGDPVDDSVISIHFCSRIFSPVPSKAQAFPFDDPDSLAIVPWLARGSRRDAWCGAALEAADFNVSYERVDNTDGSLSNYAVLRGIDYLNFETQDRGSAPAGLTEARDRLVAMIDSAMIACATPANRPQTPQAIRLR
jgi:hypothetical protein